eukprot:13536011-Alexandrium_andersonii.AAC.1
MDNTAAHRCELFRAVCSSPLWGAHRPLQTAHKCFRFMPDALFGVSGGGGGADHPSESSAGFAA